jgi:hypothetical protein
MALAMFNSITASTSRAETAAAGLPTADEMVDLIHRIGTL